MHHLTWTYTLVTPVFVEVSVSYTSLCQMCQSGTPVFVRCVNQVHQSLSDVSTRDTSLCQMCQSGTSFFVEVSITTLSDESVSYSRVGIHERDQAQVESKIRSGLHLFILNLS